MKKREQNACLLSTPYRQDVGGDIVDPLQSGVTGIFAELILLGRKTYVDNPIYLYFQRLLEYSRRSASTSASAANACSALA